MSRKHQPSPPRRRTIKPVVNRTALDETSLPAAFKRGAGTPMGAVRARQVVRKGVVRPTRRVD
jgi:hypothetical protein